MSIREKLLIFVLCGTVLPMALVFLVSHSMQSKEVRKSVATTLQSDAVQSINAVHERVLQARHGLNNIHRQPVSDTAIFYELLDSLQSDIDSLLASDPFFAEITVLDETGTVLSSTDRALKDTDMSELAAYKLAISGKHQFAEPHYSDKFSSHVSIQAFPIMDIENNVAGVILGYLDWSHIKVALEDKTILGEDQSIDQVIRLTSLSNNTLLYQSKDTNLSSETKTKQTYGELIEVLNDGQEFVSITLKPDSNDTYKDSTLLIQLLVKETTAYAQINRLTQIYLWISLGVFLVVGVMWWLLSNSLTKRINSLAQGARELSKGNFAYKLDEQVKYDDIGRLTHSFLFMRRTIEQNEQALIEKTEAAEQAAKLKGEFLANMSHEVRTPINGVLGMAELMLQTNLDIHQKRYASTILRSGQSLLSVVNDILDFSKIEAGKLDITNAPFDLRETVEDVTEMLAESAHRKGLELNVEISPDMHVAFNGDAGRIRQILINLISNSVKFTSEGEVRVCVHHFPGKSDGPSNIKFEVIDTGIGISAEQQSRIFQEFEQADGSTTREYGGSGLGLAISKKLAELMGGGISVISTPGEGSTFWFSAQVEMLPESIQQRWACTDSLQDRRFLIVDDNQTNREILRTQLAHWGAQTLVANSPDHALQLVEDSINQNDPIDVAIVDHQMPVMSGIDLIKTIQKTWPNDPLSYVVLSSVNEDRDTTSINSLAEYSYVTKPVRQKDLYNCLAAALGDDRAINASIDSKKAELSVFKGDILLVEDNPVNQDMMLEMLRLMGLKADLAENGKEAVELITKNRYDLAFMDCQMPVMDGFAATTEIRKMESSRHDGFRQPIVALTANALEGDRERCINAGMDDYLSKPISTAELKMCLQKWLPQDAAANDADAGETESTPTAERSGESAVDELPIINQDIYEQVLTMCEQASAGFYDRLMEKYRSSAEEDLESIQTAIAAQDSETIRTSAHRLKSSSGNWGGVRVSDLCQKIESAGRDKDVDLAASLFDNLKNEVDTLINELDDHQRAA